MLLTARQEKNHNFEYKHAGVSTQTGFQLKPAYVSRHLNRTKSRGLGQAITASCQVHLKFFVEAQVSTDWG